MIRERNLQKYGDPVGPTEEYFIARGLSDDQMIESAMRTGGEDLPFLWWTFR